MIKLLKTLIKVYSEQECIYFSWYASQKLQKRVEEINGPKFRKPESTLLVKLALLPTCAQFLNVIESVFSATARAIIHNSDYQSVYDCKCTIGNCFFE